MKKLILICLPVFFLIFAATVTLAQDKTVVPANYQVDTRVDNMGYWRQCAALGLVPVEPMHKPVPATYTGSWVIADGILVEDSPDVPVTTETSTQSENSTVVNPNNRAHALNSNNSTPVPAGSIYGANYFQSYDEGETWDGQLQGAGGSNSGDPAACINLNGRYYIGFIDNAMGQSVSYSDDDGATWTVSKAASAPSGFGNMLDKNHLWVDKSPTSPNKGNLYDAFTTFGGSNDSEIGITTSTNNGVSWTTVQHISAAVNAGSHNQGVNLKTGPDGEAYAAWAIYDSWPSDEKAIGFSKSLDGGITWEPAVRIINNIKGIRTSEVTPNHRVNSFPSMAVDISNSPNRGTIYVVWTNKGVPGVNSGSGCDIYIIKSTDEGATWSTPVKINTDPEGTGKEHYFPWIACDQANGMLSVVFYDNRNVSNNQTETWMAYSEDGGDTWTDMKVSDVSMTPAPIPGLATGYMGDYLGIDAYDGKVYPTWADNRSGQVMTYVSPIDLLLPAPKLVHEDHEIDDSQSATNDGVMSYGDTILMGVKIKNIGSLDASDVQVTMKSNSPYITFLDSTESYGAIAQGGSKMIEDGFRFAVSINIPNNLPVQFICEAHDQNDSITVSTFSITSYAPDPTIISLAVQDPLGNNNGRLEPGETATLNILTRNTGIYTAANVVSLLTSNNPFVIVEDGSYTLGDLTAGQEKTAIFTVTVDPSLYWGSGVTFHNIAQAEYQANTKDFTLPIGLIVEDWETGNFTKFDWQFGGNADWTIDPDTKWEGSYSSKSGVVGNSQKSELILDYNVMLDDSISFYRKVSSQPLSDLLRFYIDGLQVGLWGGNQDWKRVSYPVLAGPHTFKWVYEKDNANSMNLDCAWTDFIVFPPEYQIAVNAGGNETTCGTEPYQLEAMAINYDSLLWTTSGTGLFSDPKILQPTYTPSTDDMTAGSVILTLTAYAMGGIDSTDQMLLTIAEAVTAFAGDDASLCSNATLTLASATAVNYSSLAWTTSGDGMFNDNTVLNPVYTPGPNDISSGSAILKLTAVAAAACPDATDSLLVTILPAPEVSLGTDTLICAHLVYQLDATTPDAVSYLWSPGGETTPTITVDSTGTGIGIKAVSVMITVANGCQASDEVNIQFKDCTGIREIEGISFELYPNPATGTVTIELTTRDPRTVQIELLNLKGERQLGLDPVTVNGTLKQRMNLSSLPQGTYLVRISESGKQELKKLVIAR